MKHLKNFKAILALFFCLAFFNSCKKEGCTDIYATNYDSAAKTNDGSCQYEGTVQFWYNQSTSQNLIDDGSTSLTISVDGNVIGSYATSVYFSGEPSCGQASIVRTVKNLGSSKTKAATYRVIDDFGDEIWAGNFTFDAANECYSIKLTY